MTDFAALLTPGRVLCNVEARSQKHAFEILSELLANADHGLSSSDIFDALIQRERLGGTGLGQGVALPHGRLRDLTDSVAAVMRLREAIPYDTPDDENVRLVFGLIVPEEANEAHLHNISAVARRLLQPGFVDALLAAGSSSAIHELFVVGGDQEAGPADDVEPGSGAAEPASDPPSGR